MTLWIWVLDRVQELCVDGERLRRHGLGGGVGSAGVAVAGRFAARRRWLNHCSERVYASAGREPLQGDERSDDSESYL